MIMMTRIIMMMMTIMIKFQNGDTSLHIAAAMGRRKLTRLLVECGTDPEVRNKQGETAGEIAVRRYISI